MSVQIGTVQTFKDVKADKEQAVKILEEAGEVVDAFKAYREAALTDWTEPDNANEYRMACDHLIDECADVLQSTCNLLSALNVVDMTKWIERCKAKNERRGREYADDRERITDSGKLSDSREQLEADYDLLLELERRIKTWRDYDGNFLRLYDSVAYAQIKELLEKQAAITRAELVDCANCPITERNAKVIAELREQLDETKHAIAKAGGTWTEHEDGSVAVVFSPDVDKLRTNLYAARAKNRALKAHIADMQNCRHGWHVKANELQEKVDELTAERDDLKEDNRRYEHDCELLWQEKRELTAERDEMQRQLDTMRDVTREFRDERDMWRDKCGKMLDIAHEIARLGDVE